jgi:hypothetical protein
VVKNQLNFQGIQLKEINMKWKILGYCGFLLMLACSGPKVQLDESGGTEPLEEQIALIKEHIKDPERQEKCLAIAEDWRKKLTAFSVEYREHVKRIKTLQADYQASESQFQAAYDRFNPRFEAMLHKLISARQALVALTTEEEWKKISAREKSYIPKTSH